MHFHQLFDHVLSELEFGRTENGINLLVGMLDAAELGQGAARQAGDQLHHHPLHRMLLEDPLLADAQQRPSNPVHRVNMLNYRTFEEGVSSTGRRLFAATSDLAFTRALRSRREHAERKLYRAWRKGLKIWLISDPQCGMMASLGSLDTSNITVSSEASVRGSSHPMGIERPAFDLILAPYLPDQFSSRALRQLSVELCQSLSAAGELATSVLLPGHPGAGWRRTCFSWEPNCHDERELANMGASPFAAQHYRDETGCVGWIEFRRV